MDGATLVAGAECDTTAGGNCDGSAYVFVRSRGSWVQQAKLIPPNIGRYDEFGTSVAVSGNTLAAGPGYGTGAAYVFARVGTTWTLQTKLLAPEPSERAFFGDPVAIDGDTVLVGSYTDDTPLGENAGAAYVFVRSGATWQLQARLTAADGVAGGGFGLALDGDTAVVLDRRLFGQQRPDAGYVFLRKGTAWTQQARLTVSSGPAFDEFSTDVDVSGPVIVMGASASRSDSEAAYVFVRSGSTWVQRARLVGPEPAEDERFGTAVAVDAATIVVGALNRGTEGQGAVFIYGR